jgi:hypothetical protein
MQGRFSYLSQPELPEAQPEAKAYVLLLIKKYIPREVEMQEKRREAEKQGVLLSSMAHCSVSKAPLLRGTGDSISKQCIPRGTEAHMQVSPLTGGRCTPQSMNPHTFGLCEAPQNSHSKVVGSCQQNGLRTGVEGVH